MGGTTEAPQFRQNTAVQGHPSDQFLIFNADLLLEETVITRLFFSSDSSLVPE